VWVLEFLALFIRIGNNIEERETYKSLSIGGKLLVPLGAFVGVLAVLTENRFLSLLENLEGLLVSVSIIQ
jgi:hypothetical protein